MTSIIESGESQRIEVADDFNLLTWGRTLSH